MACLGDKQAWSWAAGSSTSDVRSEACGTPAVYIHDHIQVGDII